MIVLQNIVFLHFTLPFSIKM